MDVGGTPLLTYLVQMDGGSASSDFTTITTVADAASDEFTTTPGTTNLVTGDIYNFRVIA